MSSESMSSSSPQATSNVSILGLQERLYIAVLLCLGILGLVVLVQNLPVIEQR